MAMRCGVASWRASLPRRSAGGHWVAVANARTFAFAILCVCWRGGRTTPTPETSTLTTETPSPLATTPRSVPPHLHPTASSSPSLRHILADPTANRDGDLLELFSHFSGSGRGRTNSGTKAHRKRCDDEPRK